MSCNPRIIIIGAGAAGYAAACKLLENGFTNIRILEAENRIGGRIHSFKFGDGMVDLGAQWCHGEQNNIVYKMVKDLNLLQPSICNYENNFLFVDSQGNFIDSNVSNVLTDILLRIGNDIDELKIDNGSYGEFITKKYYNELKNNPEIDKNIAKQVLEWFHKITNNLNASFNWFDVSAKGLAVYEECEGDMTLNWKDKGYKTIFSVLKKEIPDPEQALPVDDKIRFNKEVCKIIWDSYRRKRIKEVIVECSDGSKYAAEHVILTISLGVLKDSYKYLFSPELPLFKKNAIQGLSFGCINKIFLKFPFKWWPDDCSGFEIVWTNDDLEKLVTEFPEGPHKNGKSWLEGIFGFHPIDNNPTILLVFLNGDNVIEAETITDEVIAMGCLFLLKKFVGKHFDIPPPEAVLRSAWFSNIHFRGTYSYRSLETEKVQTGANELAQSLGDNNALLFAGEATHPKYYSTVHGAIESGYREAYKLISMYNSISPAKKFKCKVAIIGAGISGLGAAVTLVNAGYRNILLLEAQNYIGGRIRSQEIANGYIDLGAQWLHGDQNPLWKISADNDLLSSRTVYEGRGLFLREDGHKFNEFLVEKVSFIIGKILDECEEFVDANDSPESVGHYLQQKFTEYLKATSLTDDEIRLYLELYDWHVRFQIIDNSCDNLYNVSAKFWGRYFCPCSNGQAHINYSRGHSSVIDALVNQLPDNILLTNMPVNNIDWTMTECNAVKLRCQNHPDIEADTVIVTSSLGVLKKRANKMFTPPLPTATTDIISAMGFSGICKIFLLFDNKWWTDDDEGFQLIFNYDNNYGDDWTRYLSGFDPVLDQPNMLLGWIGGKGAEIVETISEEEIGQKCTELLRQFTGKYDIQIPSKVVRTKWTTNSWILGGYSHTTPKCDNIVLLPEKLQEPIRDSQGNIRILLAGEHTHPEHFSTTHGAFQTGLHQAQILLQEENI